MMCACVREGSKREMDESERERVREINREERDRVRDRACEKNVERKTSHE